MWDSILNTAPSTTVLMGEALVWFDAKTKTVGKSEGRPCGFSKKGVSKGVLLPKSESGDLSRDFWLGRPLGV